MFRVPSDGVSSSCWDHVPPEFPNTYAAPVPKFLPKAPTTAVAPEMATLAPKESLAAPSEAMSLACSVQIEPE